LQRTHDALKSEIQTYENNMGFLTAHSKGGNKLVEGIAKKVETLKVELAKVATQIKQLDKPAPAPVKEEEVAPPTEEVVVTQEEATPAAPIEEPADEAPGTDTSES
jgi:archaellum component FlaC